MSREFPYPESAIRPGGSDWWDTDAAQLVIYDYFDQPVVGEDATATPSGVTSSGNTGTATTTASSSVARNGVSASGNIGTPIIVASATRILSGVSASNALGDTTLRGGATKSILGVSASSITENCVASTSASRLVSGAASTTTVGAVVVQASANDVCDGVASTSSVGTPIVAGSSSSTTNGLASLSFVGVVACSAAANEDVAGVSTSGASPFSGTSVTMSASAGILPTGVVATFEMGVVSAIAIQPTAPPPNRKYIIQPSYSTVSISAVQNVAVIQERQNTIKAA